MTDTMADLSAAPRDSRIITRFVQANGLTFEVDQCGEGDKLAICLHGFPESSYSWRYQLPMLADIGYTAWAPNLRGYGKSSRPPFVEDYAMQHLLDDVAGLIDAAGKQEVVLIAHDWGAVIAWQFAMAKVRPLTKLIICNVPHPVAMQKAFSLAQLKKSWYVFFFQIPGLAEKLLGMVNYYRALLRFRTKPKKGEKSPIISTPTLMIWGEDDVALTKETTYGTENYVDDFRIRYLPRISHWVQQEAPEATNEMIKAFLQNQPVPYAQWQMNLVASLISTSDEPAIDEAES